MPSERPPQNRTGKREAILRAATRIFAQNGFFNSKVAEIAREAGVADGTVYLYFKSKDDILFSIFDYGINLVISECREKIAELVDPVEKLRIVANLHLERLSEDRDMAIVFQVELRSSTKFMEQFTQSGFGDYLNLLRSIIEEGQDRGLFRTDLSSKVLSKFLYGALDEMATNWILSKRKYKLAPMADQVIELFFHGAIKR